jgi:chromosome partitioning protein
VPEALASLKTRYGEKLCETRIQDDPALSESPAHGMDIFAYSADSPGAHDYRLLTMELLVQGFFPVSAEEATACPTPTG